MMPEFPRWTSNARASPGGDACQQPPADMRSGRGVLRGTRPQLKKIVERHQGRKLECGIDDWERERAGRSLQKKEHRYPMCAGN